MHGSEKIKFVANDERENLKSNYMLFRPLYAVIECVFEDVVYISASTMKWIGTENLTCL